MKTLPANINKSFLEVQADPAIKSVSVVFDPQGQAYTYKTLLDFQVGDFAVVKVKDEFKVVQVVAFSPQGAFIDPKANFQYGWAFQKILTQHHDALVARSLNFTPEQDWA